MKFIVIFAIFASISVGALAQSKVFTAVGNEIDVESKTIISDNKVIGYAIFSRLEKADKDSFNYKLTILDENLNDIGIVNFKELGLNFEAISFDQDVLCLAYIKGKDIGTELTYKEYKEARDRNFKDYLFTQFISLEGKIISTETTPIRTEGSYQPGQYGNGFQYSYKYFTKLKQPIQLSSVPEKGFLLFYGEESGTKLLSYDAAGRRLWESKAPTGIGHILKNNSSKIYLLTKTESGMGNYQIVDYSLATGLKGKTKSLKDKEDNPLEVLSFTNIPGQESFYLSGYVGNSRYENARKIKFYKKQVYKGVFSFEIDSTAKNGLRENFSYWSDGSKNPEVAKNGFTSPDKSHTLIASSYRDFEGNTYFVGQRLKKQPRIGGMITSVVFSLSVVVPLIELGLGFNKYYVNDAKIFKLTPKGVLTVDNIIPQQKSSKMMSMVGIDALTYGKSSYSLSSPEDKATYVILQDYKDSKIYSVEKKKILRTVPKTDKNFYTSLSPAKEGHIMVIETDRKARTTRLSIEKLQ